MAAHDNDKVFSLAQRLCPEEGTLVDEVKLAVADPQAYVRRFARRLALRGVKKPLAELPWIALVDGLSARGRLEEIDWREEPDAIMEAVDELLGDDALDWDWVEEEELEEAPTEEFLRRVGDHLYKSGIALAFLDIGADCYPLTAIDRKELKSVQRLAEGSGYGKVVLLRSRA
jgi:hypothetical protein